MCGPSTAYHAVERRSLLLLLQHLDLLSLEIKLVIATNSIADVSIGIVGGFVHGRGFIAAPAHATHNPYMHIHVL